MSSVLSFRNSRDTSIVGRSRLTHQGLRGLSAAGGAVGNSGVREQQRRQLAQSVSEDSDYDSLSSHENSEDEDEFWMQWGRSESKQQLRPVKRESQKSTPPPVYKSPSELEEAADKVIAEVNKKSSLKNEVDYRTKCCRNYIKLLVSKQKRRWESRGFSLDLTYITPKIIAMGFPAENYERYYRNSMTDVQEFFNKMHKDHYKVYNLCSERTYDKSRFPDVSCHPFEDHQAPEFTLMFRFCQDLFQYIHADPEGNNIAGVHCKAGKGRTGVMICCYLMYSGEYTYAIDALRFYGLMRTKNRKGVTIPSQIRYVQYFERALQNKWKMDEFPQIAKKIVKIKLLTIPHFNFGGGCTPFFTISYRPQQDKDQAVEYSSLYFSQNRGFIEFEIEDCLVKGDVYLQFFNQSRITNKKEKMFQLWFNCAFFEENGVMVINKNMLDTACKDKQCRLFRKEFRVEVHSVHIEQQPKLEVMRQSYLAANQAFIEERRNIASIQSISREKMD